MNEDDNFGSVELLRQALAALCAQLEGGHPPTLAAIARSLQGIQDRLEPLRARCGLLREALDQAGDAIYARDLQGRYTLSNVAGAALFGMSVEELNGLHPSQLFEQRETDRVTAADQVVLAAQETRTFEEVFQFQGQARMLLTTQAPWYDAYGRLCGLIQTSRDLTLAKRTEREAEQREERLRALAIEIVMAEERLRRSLAGALHSGLGQDVALANLGICSLFPSAGRDLREPLEAIGALLEQADRSVRSITYRISPPSLHDLGLVPALDWLAEDLAAAHAMTVIVQDSASPRVTDERVRVILYRAVRELLTNAATHGGARTARVHLAALDGSLQITVEDEGAGFDASDSSLEGYGLFGIREHLRHVGGNLDIDSAPGRGTRARLTAPVGGTLPG